MSGDFESLNLNRVTLFQPVATFQNVPGMTLMVWAFLESVLTIQTLANFSAGGSISKRRMSLSQSVTSRSASACRLDANTTVNASTTAPTAGTSEHRCATANFTTGELILYINAVQVASVNTLTTGGNTSNTGSSDATIGAISQAIPGTYTGFFDGRLAGMRTFSRVLTVPELQTIVQARGRDSNAWEQRNHWKLNQGYPGQAMNDIDVLDTGELQNAGEAFGTSIPVYAEWLITSRRRRR